MVAVSCPALPQHLESHVNLPSAARVGVPCLAQVKEKRQGDTLTVAASVTLLQKMVILPCSVFHFDDSRTDILC